MTLECPPVRMELRKPPSDLKNEQRAPVLRREVFSDIYIYLHLCKHLSCPKPLSGVHSGPFCHMSPRRRSGNSYPHLVDSLAEYRISLSDFISERSTCTSCHVSSFSFPVSGSVMCCPIVAFEYSISRLRSAVRSELGRASGHLFYLVVRRPLVHLRI